MSKPAAPLSLDLDNKWSYLMIHGDQSWESYPTYLNLLVPRVLDFLDDRNLTITFFIVGQDATQSQHREVLKEIVARGHRIGNHSFDHRPWLHRYSPDDLAADFDKSEEAIEDATGMRPLGFRGPGFSVSPGVLHELTTRGYEYDASVFPNILNPLSRAYYFWTADLTPEERKEREALFGTLSTAFQRNKPHRWGTNGNELAEIPVTTFPLFRTPMHLSYLTYLGGKTVGLATAYFRFALAACRLAQNPPSMLLHPLDFMGRDDDEELGFFPGMNMPAGEKLELAGTFLDMLGERYDLVPVEDYVRIADTSKVISDDTLD